MFDLDNSKNRIIEILNDETIIEDKKSVPAYDGALTYANGIKAWVTALFLDIRKSAEYFKNDADMVSRVMRSYIQELVTLLKDHDQEKELIRDIGIRGDCVYAIFTTPKKADINYVFDVVLHIYSFNKMFQRVLSKNGFATFDIGIGLGSNKDVVIKTGKPYSDVNEMVWVGKAVVDAAHLSAYGNSDEYDYKTIVMNKCFYNNLDENNKKYMAEVVDYTGDSIYHGDVCFTDENNWIERNV